MAFFTFLALCLGASALTSASQLVPPVLPLIVRNPYLSTWLTNAREPPWEQWPMFWGGQQIGFSVMALASDTKTVYPLLGRPHDSIEPQTAAVSFATYKGFSFDASTTNLTYELELKDTSHVEITLSFVSPVTPSSTFRQSLPVAYMAAYVKGNADISIYTDINGDWVSGDRGSQITWDLEDYSSEGLSASPLKSWKVSRASQQLLSEIEDRAEWGTLLFTTSSDVDHQSGDAATLRDQFAKKGSLTNTTDSRYRAIDADEPAFAFSRTFNLQDRQLLHDTEAEDSVLFTLALVQDPVVQYAAARGLTYMRPLWASYIPETSQMIHFHFHDFHRVSSLAQSYSSQLITDAQKEISPAYADIVALSARQVLGSTQFSGTPESPMIFLKEISSNGNFQTVDVIFPAFPFFLYTNPQWLAYLLEPLIEHQLSGQYPNNYSMHDLGAHFPNATGHADGNDEYMPVEECGDMLIMGLALINALQDSAQPAWSDPSNEDENLDHDLQNNIGSRKSEALRGWVSKSYALWKRWAGYLVRESLIPRNQLCTDDFAGWLANQTNLALKGIIGIRAMSEISSFLGKEDDADFYRNISESYIEQWQGLGISRDGTHAKLSYTWYGSWTTIYNLYADALLCFHLPESENEHGDIDGVQHPLRRRAKKPFIPGRVYKMQSRWYMAVLQQYGLPLDSRHLYTKSDWQFFAGAVAGRKTRNAIVDTIATWVNETITDRPLTDLYDTEGEGDFSPVRFMARPVVGGHFAPLALARACHGKALEGLAFLDSQDEHSSMPIDVAAALARDKEEDIFDDGFESIGEL